MAPGATDRPVGAHGLRRDRSRGAGLAQIGPGFLRKIKCKRQHVVSLQGLSDRSHRVALAGAALEVTQLQIEVALVLTPDYRPGFVRRNTVVAVTAGTNLRLLVDRLRGDRTRDGIKSDKNRGYGGSAPLGGTAKVSDSGCADR